VTETSSKSEEEGEANQSRSISISAMIKIPKIVVPTVLGHPQNLTPKNLKRVDSDATLTVGFFFLLILGVLRMY